MIMVFAIWLIVAGVFYVIEVMSMQLVSIWLVAGSIGAAFAALFGASFAVQLWVFFIVSLLFLIILRPIAKSKLQSKPVSTNVDRVIGMNGIVTEPVDNLAMTGRVTANGLSWSARTPVDSMRLSEGDKIKVLAIDGVKLIVEPVMDQSESPSTDNTNI